ncbi:MAG: C40 family peptidase [Deltaproteobacteria bacterium]|jgi:LysM repeat protein|nr:C40 family peptidase [Deltaproteobacteria bacterium]
MSYLRLNTSIKYAFLPILLLVLFLPGCFKTDQAKVFKQKDPITSIYTLNQQRVNQILRTAFSQIGNPYRYGGNSPETGFDCSGFVSWVYKQYGILLPRSSRDMLAVGEPIPREELRPGDLVFFNYGYSHVGIYTGEDKYIHSPRTGKRIEEVYLTAKGRGDHFVGARRIIDNIGVNIISDQLKNQWIAQSRHQTDLALQASLGQKHSALPNSRVTQSTITASNKLSPTKTASVKAKVVKKASTVKAVTKSSGAKKTAKAKQNTYKVVSGDNLVTLAKRYGLSSNEIALANNIKNKNKLKPGQLLIIPPKAKATVVAKKSKNKVTKTTSVQKTKTKS